MNQGEAETIEILAGIAAIRRRPHMYIGDTGVRGLHWMVRQLLECPYHLEGGTVEFGSTELNIEARCTPPSMEPRYAGAPPYLVEACTVFCVPSPPPTAPQTLASLEAIHVERGVAKYVATGTVGPALAVANALSERFEVRSRQRKRAIVASFQRGQIQGSPVVVDDSRPDGLSLSLSLDGEIFGQTEFSLEHLAEVCRDIAFVKAVPIVLADRRSNVRYEVEGRVGCRSTCAQGTLPSDG